MCHADGGNVLNRRARERVLEELGELHCRLQLKVNEARMVLAASIWPWLVSGLRVVKGNLAGKAEETFRQRL